MNNLQQRVITSILFVAVLLGSILLGELASASLFFVIILLAQNEFYNFFKGSEIKPQKVIGIIAGLSYFLISVLTVKHSINLGALFLVIPMIFGIFILELFRNKPQAIPNIAYTILGIIYIAVPFTLLHEMAYFYEFYFGSSYNSDILIGFFFILWANDTGAYFAGRSLGKRKLFERISPKKTWEGSIGGALFGLGVAYLNSILFPSLDIKVWLCIGSIIVVFGSIGDLVESMFKRSLNIKDSGSILPGHGGILDRFDGVFISAPIVYAFLKIVSYL